MRILALLISVLSFTAFAQQDQKLPGNKWAFYGEEFYTALASGKKLEKDLFDNILNSTHGSSKGKFDVLGTSCVKGTTCYKHVSVGYDRARKIMFGELDMKRDAKGTYVVDVYCGKKFYFESADDASDMHNEVNIEHTWPQSKFNKSFPKDQQKSDMHHLYLADTHANSVRGNSPFGFVTSFDDVSVGDGCASRYGLVDHQDTYTPPPAHRGNVARSLFYFSMHYRLNIKSSEEAILRKWHKDDPVDAAEIARHEGIAQYEKVRNPFVDHPEIVDQVSDF